MTIWWLLSVAALGNDWQRGSAWAGSILARSTGKLPVQDRLVELLGQAQREANVLRRKLTQSNQPGRHKPGIADFQMIAGRVEDWSCLRAAFSAGQFVILKLTRPSSWNVRGRGEPWRRPDPLP